MANVVKCAYGHFYDAEKSKECPYCQKREEERVVLIDKVKNAPQFTPIRGGINDDVTVAMPADPSKRPDIVVLDNKRAPVDGIGSDEGMTIGIFKKQLGMGYVTGWLVCVEGPVKGRDYRIMHGMNWIGDSPNMDIWIDGGVGISKYRHCAIAYDRKGNQFFIVPGNSSLTYINGELLNYNHQLQLGDSIGIGNCIFEFIPFCREGHIWAEEENSN